MGSPTLVVFNDSNRALLRREPDGRLGPSAAGADAAEAMARFEAWAGRACTAQAWGGGLHVALVEDLDHGPEDGVFLTLEEIEASTELAPSLADVRGALVARAGRIPYLNHGEHDFIYKFRTEKERNRDIYRSDQRSRALYQSELCQAIKAARRVRERTAAEPALLDFGPVRYVLPSHFGFCLGVQNAIERAYESLAENPGRRVFMLSELIHNPFVNEDLLARGLRYLQTDRGIHLVNPATGRTWWEELRADDIVIIPAFGATDADKLRLIRKGIPLNRFDATCMLVEKVWKAARRFGVEGYTVVLHGKAEHEETKATFSNTVRHAPCVIVRDQAEAARLCDVIREADPEAQRRLFAPLAGKASAGFDPTVHLGRIAVVNQTTLLRNETLGIINQLEAALRARFGDADLPTRLSRASRGDTLCYATQVNQDALERALALPADGAVVVGGRNSSNTVQLWRLCEQRFGPRAFYIQSEADIRADGTVAHLDPLHKGDPPPDAEPPALLLTKRPLTFVLTGGASCPDGLIQQVIARINTFFSPADLRSPADVLASL